MYSSHMQAIFWRSRMKIVNLLCLVSFLLISESCVFDNSPASYNGTVGSSYQFNCVALSCDHVDVYKNGIDITNSCQIKCSSTICEVICTLVLLENNTIVCYGINRPSPTIHSNKAIILVQDHLDPVTNIISHVNLTHITFNWDIPPVLDGIEIVFSLSLRYVNYSVLIANVSNITTNLWTIELSQDPCILGNLTISGIAGPLESSSHLSNIIFPHRPPVSNFTSKLNKHFNGSTTFIMKYKEQCDCPGKQSTHSTIIAHYKDHSSTIYNDIPVTKVGCTGIIKSNADHQLEFLGDEYIQIELWLKSKGGQTKQPTLEFNTNDIQDAHYIEGNITTGPCFQCVFENDVLTHNDHATGCNISLLNVNTTERIYISLYRENESSAFGCFIWFPSGYYDICYTSLPLSKEYEICQYSIYINGTEPENPIKPTKGNLSSIIGSGVASVIALFVVAVVSLCVIKNWKQLKKLILPKRTILSTEATGDNYQENSGVMVNKPIILQPGELAPTVAASIRHSSIVETSETKHLLSSNTNTRSSDSSDITSFDPIHYQRTLSTVDEVETSFNDNKDNNRHSLNQLNIPVEVHDINMPKSLEPSSPSSSPSPSSHVLPKTNERRLESQQDISNNEEENEDSDNVFSYPEPLQDTNIQTSNSLPNFSRHRSQPSFFRTNSETSEYPKELSAVPEDNDFITFEACSQNDKKI